MKILNSLVKLGLNQGIDNRGSQDRTYYILRDEFTTALAADAVHGTNADPGPGGARTVADTASKISVANNALSVNGGVASPDWGDPSLWYPALTKVAGLMILSKVTPAATNKECAIGFDNQASGSTYIDKGLQFRDTGTINAVRTSAVATCVVGSYSASTAYQFMTVLRAAGGICFVKGGAYTNWTLLWVDDSANMGASVYPAIMGKNMVFTTDYARIPQTLWLPSPLASDSFNRDNGTIGTTDGAGHAESTGLGAGGSGLAWTGATWTIATNVALNTPATLGSELVTNGNMELDSNWTDDTNMVSNRDRCAGADTGPNIGGPHGGTYARYAIATGVAAYMWSDTFAVTAGDWILLNYWVYTNDVNSEIKWLDGNGSTQVVQTWPTGVAAWTNYRIVKRMAVTGTSAKVGFASDNQGGNYVFIDDVSVKELTLSELFSSVAASTQDVIATVNITMPLGHKPVGLVANLDSTSSPANFIIAYLDGAGNAKLDKCLAGTYTNLISAAVTYSAGAPIRVLKKGLSYELYYNNLRVGTGWTANAGTDANIISNTKHGLFSTDVSNTFDSFTVYDSGSASGAYEILNNF